MRKPCRYLASKPRTRFAAIIPTRLCAGPKDSSRNGRGRQSAYGSSCKRRSSTRTGSNDLTLQPNQVGPAVRIALRDCFHRVGCGVFIDQREMHTPGLCTTIAGIVEVELGAVLH